MLCFAITKSSTLMSDAAWRLDLAAHKKQAIREWQVLYRETLAELPAAIAYRVPEGFVAAGAPTAEEDEEFEQAADARDEHDTSFGTTNEAAQEDEGDLDDSYRGMHMDDEGGDSGL